MSISPSDFINLLYLLQTIVINTSLCNVFFYTIFTPLIAIQVYIKNPSIYLPQHSHLIQYMTLSPQSVTILLITVEATTTSHPEQRH